jgi:hypothetical protein
LKNAVADWAFRAITMNSSFRQWDRSDLPFGSSVSRPS